MTPPSETAILVQRPWMVGVYEGHHLLCPLHGRQVQSSTNPERAACGCRPVILWNTTSWGEHPPLDVDTLGIGRRQCSSE